MVLAELGGKLRESLRKLHATATGSEADDEGAQLERKVAALASEISRALIESDVNVKIVMKLRDTIISRSRQEVVASLGGGKMAGSNRRGAQMNPTKLVQKIVVEELISLVSPESSSSPTATNTSSNMRSTGGSGKDRVLKRGKTNVILFVGLQGTRQSGDAMLHAACCLSSSLT
jgi:signal recognition particle subunit SRP54